MKKLITLLFLFFALEYPAQAQFIRAVHFETHDCAVVLEVHRRLGLYAIEVKIDNIKSLIFEGFTEKQLEKELSKSHRPKRK